MNFGSHQLEPDFWIFDLVLIDRTLNFENLTGTRIPAEYRKSGSLSSDCHPLLLGAGAGMHMHVVTLLFVKR